MQCKYGVKIITKCITNRLLPKIQDICSVYELNENNISSKNLLCSYLVSCEIIVIIVLGYSVMRRFALAGRFSGYEVASVTRFF